MFCRSNLTSTLLLFLLSTALVFIECRIFEVSFESERRKAIVINVFGHDAGGVLNITTTAFKIHVPENTGDVRINVDEIQRHIGFVYHKVVSDTSAHFEAEFRVQKNGCFLDSSLLRMIDTSQVVAISDQPSLVRIGPGGNGLYALFYYNCEKTVDVPISFSLHIEQYNVHDSSSLFSSALSSSSSSSSKSAARTLKKEYQILQDVESLFNNKKNLQRDYLTLGEAPLPIVYFVSSAAFLAITIVWMYYLWNYKQEVLKIHTLMAILVALKTISTLLEAIRFFYLSRNGVALEWSILYYIFAILKGFMTIIVVLLLASGWSIVKSYLNRGEKRLLLTVLTLQCITNVAMVVIEQNMEGASTWLFWRQVLIWGDLACCALVLPVISCSIRNLRGATSVDGKAVHNATRLGQFQQFYLIVFGYLFFARIFIRFAQNNLDHSKYWLPDMIHEVLLFFIFCVIGHQFRPISFSLVSPKNEQTSVTSTAASISFGNLTDSIIGSIRKNVQPITNLYSLYRSSKESTNVEPSTLHERVVLSRNEQAV